MDSVIELAIFDIDGPVTDPQSRKIEQPEILDLTLDFLVEKGYVAYNTGRASSVAQRRVISPLLDRAQVRGMSGEIVSHRISIIAEKGGVTSFWDDELGRWNHRISPAVMVPYGLRGEIIALLGDDHEFQKYIFHDADKETMVSVEMRHQTTGPAPEPVTVDVFARVAERFAARATQLANDRDYDQLEVDRTTIAVDIQHRGVGKDLGTRLAFGWLHELGEHVTRVHCFGDSESDVAMAVEARSVMSGWYDDAGDRVVYVHVGAAPVTSGDFQVRNYPGMYGHGTVAYLRELHGCAHGGC